MGGDRGRTVRHYLPVVVGGVGLALLVGLAPTVESRGVAPDVGPAATTPVFPVGDAPQDPGVAASGVCRGPGVRQVPRSHYAPLCQPACRGANGAETTPGVTATTITVTSQYAATSAEQALFVQLAPGTFASHAQAIALERATIGLFNRSFDLYGRRVVLKTFAGQGDFLDELSSGGLAGAEADAATARSLGAFADVSDTIFNTQPYDDALAAQHVVSVGGLFASAAHLRAEAPYEYFPGPLPWARLREDRGRHDRARRSRHGWHAGRLRWLAGPCVRAPRIRSDLARERRLGSVRTGLRDRSGPTLRRSPGRLDPLHRQPRRHHRGGLRGAGHGDPARASGGDDGPLRLRPDHPAVPRRGRPIPGLLPRVVDPGLRGHLQPAGQRGQPHRMGPLPERWRRHGPTGRPGGGRRLPPGHREPQRGAAAVPPVRLRASASPSRCCCCSTPCGQPVRT
jgi:hypothetical protein